MNHFYITIIMFTFIRLKSFDILNVTKYLQRFHINFRQNIIQKIPSTHSYLTDVLGTDIYKTL